ncbi:MAG: amphi-Trp domain-containing protein [Eubacteriales bacterium]
MKWGEKLFGTKQDCLEYLQQVMDQLTNGVLVLDDKDVMLPEDMHLEYKVRYSEDPGESKFSFKIAWPNDIPIEETMEEEPVEAVTGEIPEDVTAQEDIGAETIVESPEEKS